VIIPPVSQVSNLDDCNPRNIHLRSPSVNFGALANAHNQVWDYNESIIAEERFQPAKLDDAKAKIGIGGTPTICEREVEDYDRGSTVSFASKKPVG
jgi:hypothetical protein